MKSPKTPTTKDTQTCTIGLDLGDAQHTYCVLDAEANILSRGKVRNDREPLALWLSQWPGAKIVMEAGIHSPWISRLMQSAGHKVILANARKTRAIWQTSHKDDERDAETRKCG
jgi:transposase